MDDIQRLHSKRRGIKGNITKLLAKVENMISADLEGVNSQSIKESRKLVATTTQLRDKRAQIAELDTAIAVKIQTETGLEEELCNADTYLSTLEEQIAFLTEFMRISMFCPTTMNMGRGGG